MEMTRRGFLKFLTALPAITIVNVPISTAEVAAEVPTSTPVAAPTPAYLEGPAEFYLSFSDTLLPVNYLVVTHADPIAVWSDYSTLPILVPSSAPALFRFASSMQSYSYIRQWIDEMQSSFFSCRVCEARSADVLQRVGSRLVPIAKLDGVFPSSVEGRFHAENVTCEIELGFSHIGLDIDALS